MERNFIPAPSHSPLSISCLESGRLKLGPFKPNPTDKQGLSDLTSFKPQIRSGNQSPNSNTMGSLSPQVPRVGVGVFVLHKTDTAVTHDFNGSGSLPPSAKTFKFLMGKRLGSLGTGTWALAGGHLEFGESFEECAAREVLEETGLEIENVQFLTAVGGVINFETNGNEGVNGEEKVPEGARETNTMKHYVTMFMTATVKMDGSQRHYQGNQMPEVKNLEPDKCAGWEWVSWQDLVRWAGPQIQELRNADDAEIPNTRETTRRRERESGMDAIDVDDGGHRTLFPPMVWLLLQRPGVVPSLPGTI